MSQPFRRETDLSGDCFSINTPQIRLKYVILSARLDVLTPVLHNYTPRDGLMRWQRLDRWFSISNPRVDVRESTVAVVIFLFYFIETIKIVVVWNSSWYFRTLTIETRLSRKKVDNQFIINIHHYYLHYYTIIINDSVWATRARATPIIFFSLPNKIYCGHKLLYKVHFQHKSVVLVIIYWSAIKHSESVLIRYISKVNHKRIAV